MIVICVNIQAQKIDYSIPKGFKKQISAVDYRHLVDKSVEMVQKEFKVVEVRDGGILVEYDGSVAVFYLDNLIKKCNLYASNDKERDQVIEDHFNNMKDSYQKETEIDYSNFDSIKNNLSLRIYPSDFLESFGKVDPYLIRTHLEGTYTVLMFDLPGAFTPVKREFFDQWEISEDKAFQIAQQMVSQQEMYKESQVFEIDKAEFEVHFLENEDYAASYILDIANSEPDLVGEWGSVIAIPNKEIVSICKVSPEKPVDFVNYIKVFYPINLQFHEEHPQPISPHFFWFYDGKFTKIIVRATKKTVEVVAPFGLTELMIQPEDSSIEE